MTRVLPAFAIALALLTGCGGGGNNDGGNNDGGGSGGGEGPSREEFVDDANAICREGEKKINEVASDGRQEIQQASSQAERRDVVGDVLEQTADQYRPYLDRLRDLEAPENLADDWSSFLDGITEAFDLIPELADATRDNDEDKLSELTRKFSDIAGDTRPFAERTGLDDCLPDQGA